jgi:protein-tyrosine phosphatase
MTKVLMVCTANICRSPMALAVARHLVATNSTAPNWQFDAAGTHAAKPPQATDARATAALQKRGYPPQRGRSRRIVDNDFESHELILAMDDDNMAALQSLCPPQHHHKLRLLLSYAPEAGLAEVPDPYFGNAAGFERVLDLCEKGVRGLLKNHTT